MKPDEQEIECKALAITIKDVKPANAVVGRKGRVALRFALSYCVCRLTLLQNERSKIADTQGR
ncbi:MAG: hypothetical protein LBT81_02630 [Helicobacteraceae bacterium]|nr:hypothetical protein [Helicobacteraceae bacterium]